MTAEFEVTVFDRKMELVKVSCLFSYIGTLKSKLLWRAVNGRDIV